MDGTLHIWREELISYIIRKKADAMAGKAEPSESINPSFWILFIVGMVILLSLFRGFTAAVESPREAESRRRHKKNRSQDKHRD